MHYCVLPTLSIRLPVSQRELICVEHYFCLAVSATVCGMKDCMPPALPVRTLSVVHYTRNYLDVCHPLYHIGPLFTLSIVLAVQHLKNNIDT